MQRYLTVGSREVTGNKRKRRGACNRFENAESRPPRCPEPTYITAQRDTVYNWYLLVCQHTSLMTKPRMVSVVSGGRK